MKKFFVIFLHEYTMQVFRWRFFISILSLPLLMAVALLVVYLVAPRPGPDLPFGIVDPEGFLQKQASNPGASPGLELVYFDSQAGAEQALHQGEIKAYGVIPPSFSSSGQIALVSQSPINLYESRLLTQLFRDRLLQGFPAEVINRINLGSRITLQNPQGDQLDPGSKIKEALLPTLAVFIFMLAIFSTSGYLMQAVTVEKENYTMEILLTSVSHGRLLTGKLCGILAIGLTHLLVWFTFIFIVISIGQHSTRWLADLNISPMTFLVFSTSLSLAFVMIACIMIAVGATVAQATEGQQITGPFSLPFILPFLFTYQIISNPHGPLAFWLSVIPLTSPITLVIRLSVATLPLWQVALSLLIQLIFAILLAWIAGRAFRAGMLQYGKRLSLKEILHFG